MPFSVGDALIVFEEPSRSNSSALTSGTTNIGGGITSRRGDAVFLHVATTPLARTTGLCVQACTGLCKINLLFVDQVRSRGIDVRDAKGILREMCGDIC